MCTSFTVRFGVLLATTCSKMRARSALKSSAPASVYGIFTWTPLRSEMDESGFSAFVSVTAAFVPRTRTL